MRRLVRLVDSWLIPAAGRIPPASLCHEPVALQLHEIIREGEIRHERPD
jgi:hypothetical protein